MGLVKTSRYLSIQYIKGKYLKFKWMGLTNHSDIFIVFEISMCLRYRSSTVNEIVKGRNLELFMHAMIFLEIGSTQTSVKHSVQNRKQY